MKSIRTKTTLLTVCIIIVTMTVATMMGIIAIRNIGTDSSEQILLLLCESGEKNLDAYFNSVEQSVEMISAYVESDLKDTELDGLEEHLDRAREIFAKIAYKSLGVLTYYYRIDPTVSPARGFWFVNLDGDGFVEHEPTDITLYDTNDTSRLVWFTVPKATGKPVWLPPYFTDNLDVRVLSYNVPIYKDGLFIGVVGIELDYSEMAAQVDSIRLYENGYAFINDAEGKIIYHPRMDVATMRRQPSVPTGMLSPGSFIRYTFDGVEKQAVWLPLSDGMRLNVTVPVSEINAGWHRWVNQIVGASIILLVVFILITLRFTGRITRPLRELAEAAERVNAGDYDSALDYHGSDEVGILTGTFNNLLRHLKAYIGDLNDLAYADALTSVRNKGAFDIYMRELQAKVEEADAPPVFAVGIFDCDDLKKVNDQNGHDKGDIYLKNASHLICHVFEHSPVFRIGGDEFAVILQNDDFNNREQLLKLFEQRSEEACAATSLSWEKVRVAVGIAVYDPAVDEHVEDVVHRADKLMYECKRGRKQRGR